MDAHDYCKKVPCLYEHLVDEMSESEGEENASKNANFENTFIEFLEDNPWVYDKKYNKQQNFTEENIQNAWKSAAADLKKTG